MTTAKNNDIRSGAIEAILHRFTFSQACEYRDHMGFAPFHVLREGRVVCEFAAIDEDHARGMFRQSVRSHFRTGTCEADFSDIYSYEAKRRFARDVLGEDEVYFHPIDRRTIEKNLDRDAWRSRTKMRVIR
jgi:hypothetical protein